MLFILVMDILNLLISRTAAADYSNPSPPDPYNTGCPFMPMMW
jgi:hypothetical protein